MLVQEKTGMSDQFTDLQNAYDVLTTAKTDVEGESDTLKEVNLFQEDKILFLEEKIKGYEEKVNDARLGAQLPAQKQIDELSDEITRYQKEINCQNVVISSQIY